MKNISLEGKGMAGVIEAMERVFGDAIRKAGGAALKEDASRGKTVPASAIVGAPDEGTDIPSSGDLYRKVMDESKASGKPWEAKVHPGYYGDE